MEESSVDEGLGSPAFPVRASNKTLKQKLEEKEKEKEKEKDFIVNELRNDDLEEIKEEESYKI